MEVITQGITTQKTWATEECIYLMKVSFMGAESDIKKTILIVTGDSDIGHDVAKRYFGLKLGIMPEFVSGW